MTSSQGILRQSVVSISIAGFPGLIHGHDLTCQQCGKKKKNNNHFCFYSHYSRRHIKKDIAVTYVSVVPMFSSKSFIISGLIFISLIHLEFISVYGVKKHSMFFFF